MKKHYGIPGDWSLIDEHDLAIAPLARALLRYLRDHVPSPQPAATKRPRAKRPGQRFEMQQEAIRRCYPNGVSGRIATSTVMERVGKIWWRLCQEYGVDYDEPSWHSINRGLGREK